MPSAESYILPLILWNGFGTSSIIVHGYYNRSTLREILISIIVFLVSTRLLMTFFKKQFNELIYVIYGTMVNIFNLITLNQVDKKTLVYLLTPFILVGGLILHLYDILDFQI